MLSPQYRPIVGGYERAAERLSLELVARGHRVTVISERRKKSWAVKENIEGVCIQRLWCVHVPHFHTLTASISLALFLLTEGRRFDIWHVHQFGFHAALAIAIGKILNRPVVLKITSSADSGLARNTAASRFASFTAAHLKRVTAIVALTRETVTEALAFGIPAERVHCLGNGVDTATFLPKNELERSKIRQKLGVGNYRTVIFVGRLSKEKNPDGLLHAWTKASSALPSDWKLVIVGDGPMRSELQAILEERSLERSVLFSGLQDNIEQWMGCADIYVITSHSEGLSNTLLEAMASGLPVVATRVSGVTELVEESGSGLVVEVGDMDGLSLALVTLASDSELRGRLGVSARKVTEQRYAIEIVTDRHEALYRRLLAESLI